jgi:hypothetical protein
MEALAPFPDEPALADPGLADDEDDGQARLPGLVEPGVEAPELRFTPDERSA